MFSCSCDMFSEQYIIWTVASIINPLCWKLTIIIMQCDAGKTEHPLKSLDRNMQSKFESHICCTVLWTLNCGSRGLNKSIINKSKGMSSSTIYLPFCLNVQRNILTEFHFHLFIVIIKFLNYLCSEGNVQINFLCRPSVVLLMLNVCNNFVFAETVWA